MLFRSAQANATLSTQVQRFRSTANQLPDPFKDQMLRVAAAFQSDVDNSELAQLNKALNDQVAGFCRQTVEGKYPFARGSSNEIPMNQFGQMFGPGGALDRFFQTSLAKYADTSKETWTWRADQALTRSFSATTLRNFQLAAQIRDTFFAGSQMPQVQITVTPPALSGVGATAKLEVSGQSVVSSSTTSISAQALNWPGAGGREI